MRNHDKEETALFYIGWALVCLGCGLFLLYALFPHVAASLILPCMVNSLLGIYCPGCGGTRAVVSLLHGDILSSLRYHPFVLYTAIAGGWFLISQTVERLSRRRIPIGMKYRDGYVWAALLIVAANFVIKNLLLLGFQVDLLGSW